jgi:nitrile hydratase subunit beta
MSYTTQADLGGQTGFGPVVPEPEDERFHEPWEPLALALTLAMGATGSWTIDQSRAARETLPDYLQLTYYQIWIAALEKLLIERGLVTPQEIEAAHMLVPTQPVARVLHAADVAPTLARGASTERPGARVRVAFSLGQRVRTRSHAVPHHTRLPGYARGKVGTIERVHGPHVFADTNGQCLGEQPQPLYTVVFDGRELWGDDAQAGLRVSIDAWQPYLQAA